MLGPFLFIYKSLISLPSFPILKCHILSWHQLSSLPMSSLPYPSCSLNFVLPLHLPFFWLSSCVWCNLLPCSSYCCIPAHLHFVFPLFQLSITTLCHFLSSTLTLLTFYCFHILPTLIMLLQSNIVLWSSNSRYGQMLIKAVWWCGAGTRLSDQSSCLWEDRPTSQARRHNWRHRSAASNPIQIQPRGHQQSPYHFPSEELSCHSLGCVMTLVHNLKDQES